MIHPTAVIDPRAELGRDVRVGPFSVLGPEVRIGEATEIGAHAVLEGRVSIGARCYVGHGAVIGTPPQDLKYRPGTCAGVRIGDDTMIREYVTVHHATREGGDTVVGDHCLIMASSHIAHDCVVGNHVILINFAGLTGHVVVEDRATFGGLSGIRPFGRVGTFAYVGGCSRVPQDVPPFVIAAGSPARVRGVNVVGMRRAGIDLDSRRQVQRAFRVLYRSGLAPSTAVERLRAESGQQPLVARLIEFVASSKLGILPAPEEWQGDELPEQEESIF